MSQATHRALPRPLVRGRLGLAPWARSSFTIWTQTGWSAARGPQALPPPERPGARPLPCPAPCWLQLGLLGATLGLALGLLLAQRSWGWGARWLLREGRPVLSLVVCPRSTVSQPTTSPSPLGPVGLCFGPPASLRAPGQTQSGHREPPTLPATAPASSPGCPGAPSQSSSSDGLPRGPCSAGAAWAAASCAPTPAARQQEQAPVRLTEEGGGEASGPCRASAGGPLAGGPSGRPAAGAAPALCRSLTCFVPGPAIPQTRVPLRRVAACLPH